jgi:hypothetical protein
MGSEKDAPREGRIRIDGSPLWPCYFYGEGAQPWFDLPTVKVIADYYGGSCSAWQVHVLEVPRFEIRPVKGDPLYVDDNTRVTPPNWRFATVLEIHHEQRVHDMATPMPHENWVFVVEPSRHGLYATGAQSNWRWDEPEDESEWDEHYASERMARALASIGVRSQTVSTGGGCWATSLALPEGHSLHITSATGEAWAWQVYHEGEQLLAGDWPSDVDVTGAAKRVKKLIKGFGTIRA